MPKTDKIEYAKRIHQIQGWIVDGVQSALIVKQVVANGWCQSDRQAQRMLQTARDEWTKMPEAEMDQRRKIKIAELQQLKRSMKEQYKGTPSGIFAQLAVEKEIVELEGIKPSKKHDVTITNLPEIILPGKPTKDE